MRTFCGQEGKLVIQRNLNIKITEILIDVYDYVVNGQSATKWIFAKYHINRQHSVIKNYLNDWARNKMSLSLSYIFF
ncbi:MAG: hypothetical protein LBT38_00210 [Deltaproteobacteria bacterium]|nr:hypothetical protein [Deltaproteobacteria bacterium]